MTSYPKTIKRKSKLAPGYTIAMVREYEKIMTPSIRREANRVRIALGLEARQSTVK